MHVSDDVGAGVAGVTGAGPGEVGSRMTVGGWTLLAPVASQASGGAGLAGYDILYGLCWASLITGQPCRGVTGGAVTAVFGQNGAPCAEVCASIVVTY